MAQILLIRAVLHIEADDVQLAGCGHLGVQLPHGTGGGVAGIGQQRLPFQLPLCVQLFKYCLGHIDLAPDDQPLWGVFNAQRQGANGAQVLGHIFACDAVTTGGTPDEHAVFVFQGHGEAVDFGLHHIAAAFGQRGIHPLPEGKKLLIGKHIGQALQRHLMPHRLKLGKGLTAHLLGR